MLTNEAIKITEELINTMGIVDEDMQQELYLKALEVISRSGESTPIIRERINLKRQLLSHFFSMKNKDNQTQCIEVYLLREADIPTEYLPVTDDRQVELGILRETLQEMFNVLTPREASVLEYRFVDNLTFREIGEQFNVLGATVRQNELKALRKLRCCGKKYSIKDFLYEMNV